METGDWREPRAVSREPRGLKGEGVGAFIKHSLSFSNPKVLRSIVSLSFSLVLSEPNIDSYRRTDLQFSMTMDVGYNSSE